jgi:hypothetical protein
MPVGPEELHATTPAEELDEISQCQQALFVLARLKLEPPETDPRFSGVWLRWGAVQAAQRLLNE